MDVEKEVCVLLSTCVDKDDRRPSVTGVIPIDSSGSFVKPF